MTKNGCSLSMVVSYTTGKPMEMKFQKIKIKNSPVPPPSCLTQKLATGPKMTQNGCSSSMFVSYTMTSCASKTEDIEQ